jgi:DNA-directed RNA polymerase specialized sigma24 family protein
MDHSKIGHKEDLEYARQLLSGGSGAWDRFYDEFRRKLEIYINRKYPKIFSEIAVEEIFDGVGKRLTENDYKTLRDYRGECSFSSYITKATEWEIKDWLRKHSDELLHDLIDTVGGDGKDIKDSASLSDAAIDPEQDKLPDAVKALNDDLRFAFLLRYYDFFGFPLEEVRLLARKKGFSIGAITEKIVRFLEPCGEDILQPQREKQILFQQRLEKVCHEIHKLNIREHKLVGIQECGEDQQTELQEVSDKRSAFEGKKEGLLKDKAKFIITTPYEIIAEILGEDAVSTIRSRVFLAKKELARTMAKKTKTFSRNISS